MKFEKVLIKTIAIVAVVFAVVSCDTNIDSVGSEIIGDVNFERDLYGAIPQAHSKKFKRVQTNGLPGNSLGVYNDPFYGQSVYSVLSQVVPENFSPDLGTNPVLDSVVLNLPYFSEVKTTTDAETNETINTYELDSVYGSSPIDITVYKSDYFLRDVDPSSTSGERQIYYSDDFSTFNDKAKAVELAKVFDFVPSNEELSLLIPDGEDEGTSEDVVKQNPRLRIVFPEDAKNLFGDLIIDNAKSPELSNINNFVNFFRGVYLVAEPVNGPGNLVYFNISAADITLYYTTEREDDSGGGGNSRSSKVIKKDLVKRHEELKLNFSNNVVNFIENTNTPDITVATDGENKGTVDADKNLYLKGGDGFIGVLDFFSKYVRVDDNGEYVVDENQNPIILENPTEDEKKKTELDFLRSRDWLINDASITLYIDQSTLGSGGDTEPERIYIYNLETGQVLADYDLDITENDGVPVKSVINHLERITRGSDGNGEFYKIRMTKHILDVLNGDIDNVKFGLSVSQNVNIKTLGNGIVADKDEIIPFSSVVSHEGTVLYGYGSQVPESKRLKLDIFYTKSKN